MFSLNLPVFPLFIPCFPLFFPFFSPYFILVYIPILPSLPLISSHYSPHFPPILGIPFLSLAQMEDEEKKLTRKESPRDPVVPSKPEDLSFIEAQMGKVREWVQSTVPEKVQLGEIDETLKPHSPGPTSDGLPAGTEGSDVVPTLVLSPSNSYRRLVLYQQLEKEFGSREFLVEKFEVVGKFAHFSLQKFTKIHPFFILIYPMNPGRRGHLPEAKTSLIS